MSPPPPVTDLLDFLDASPSPYHAVATAAGRLEAAGFVGLDEAESWTLEDGHGYFVARGGTVVAWRMVRSPRIPGVGGFRLVGAHTDSPNLRVKPVADVSAWGFRQLGVEVYGGALFNSWLDRDLGISGRVAVGSGSDVELRLVRVDRPLLRIPQLAIHLDRGVNERGLVLNAQQHLIPLLGLAPTTEGGFKAFLAEQIGAAADEVLSFDVMLHDVQPATLLGDRDELVSAGRIDNLLSCWAAISALSSTEVPGAHLPVVCLFDHEEIGSESATGAGGSVLATLLERISLALGRDRGEHLQALAASVGVSADGAHGTHPNYPDRHDPRHPIRLDGGPVIKINANVRYATDATSSARFKLVCDAAGVPVQEFVSRSDIPCGSTIGPMTAARLGIPIVDVGVAQLAMHSARELCGAADPPRLATALEAFLASP